MTPSPFTMILPVSPRAQSSPLSIFSIRTRVPGIGTPMLPGRFPPLGFTEITGEVSVVP